MDAFASPSIHAPRTPGAWLRLGEALVLTGVLWLSLVSMPAPANSLLDASWQAMLIHAHAAGLRFGRDIIFTWGPWGFLLSLAHLGRTAAVPILVWRLFGQLLVAASLVALTWRLAPWRRLVFAAAFVAFHWPFLDTTYLILITLIGASALMREGARPWGLAAWAVALGFLSQIKFTYFVLSAAAALASAALWALRGSRVRAGAIGAGFILSFAGSWLAAGQNLDDLYPYVLRSAEVSSGYADAMGLDESWPLFLWGASLALLYAVFLWRSWRGNADRAFATCAAAFLGFAGFVVWKEGFIRADFVTFGGHVFGLFGYLLILGPVASSLFAPARRWHWFDASPLVCLAAVASVDPLYFRDGPRIVWQIFYGSAHAAATASEQPALWQAGFEEAQEAAALPAIRAAVGTGTVDVYGYSVGAALLNGLTLSTRPIFQSYSAYTPSLEGWNIRFYQSARAPDFLMWKEERIDGRYPGEDDAMLLAALPGHYEPVLTEGSYWLFRRTSAVPAGEPERRRVLTRTVRIAEEIEVPASTGSALWIMADPVPNMLGRLRAAAYRPALIQIVTTDSEGSQATWRLLPRVARSGFILVPTLANGGDLALLEKGEARSRIRSFHFDAPDGQSEFWSRIDVSLDSMPGLPLRGGAAP